MTATVTDLASRRRNPEPPASCCPCRPGRLCYPHRLTNLTALLDLQLAAADGLLVTREALEQMVATTHEVIDAIADECLPHDRNPR